MTAIRLIFAFAAVGLLAGEACAAPAADSNPAPQSQPATPADKSAKPAPKTKPASKSEKSDKSAKPTDKSEKADKSGKTASKSEKSAKAPEKSGKSAPKPDKAEKATAHASAKGAPGPKSLAAPTRSSVPSSGVVAGTGPDVTGSPPPYTPSTIPLRPGLAPAAAPARPKQTLALAATSNTSPLDVAAVKQAIDLVHKSRTDEATSIEGTISDPVARKLVEWAILRSDNADLDFQRYATFIAANPTWPSISALRRRAEAALWQQQADRRAVIDFFKGDPPRTAKGRFALARALLGEGDQAGAQAAVREAWRKDSFSADLETQARDMFAGLITPADDKARMDARFDLEDDDAGMRAAQHLGALEIAIAKARTAVINKSSKAKACWRKCPRRAGTIPVMFSVAPNGCGAATRSWKPDSG